MPYIYNITFFTGEKHFHELTRLLLSEFLNESRKDKSVKFLHLSRVLSNPAAEAMTGDEQAISLSMQFYFDSKVSLEKWREEGYAHGMNIVSTRFGEEVLHFDTVLEVLDIQ